MENILHLFMNIGVRFWGYCFCVKFVLTHYRPCSSMQEKVYYRVILAKEYIEKFKAILFLVAIFSIGNMVTCDD